MTFMNTIDGGITAVKGFKATGAAVGIKKGKKDMAMIFSEAPAMFAATFTTNVVKAAPSIGTKKYSRKGNLCERL